MTNKADLDCHYDVVVIGAGPAGLATATALAKCGVTVACAGPRPALPTAVHDTRTIALMGGSVELLKTLEIWDLCSEKAEALKTIQMIDATGNYLKAPPIQFHSSEVGLSAFGYNVPQRVLVSALYNSLAASPNAAYIETDGVANISLNASAVRLTLEDGRELSANLVAGADGRNSITRRAAKIDTIHWDHGQTAIACDFTHAKPHNNVSTEFHRKAGPFTLVPLPGLKSGLVWVEKSADAEKLMQLDDEAFMEKMNAILLGLMGHIGFIGPRASFPLAIQTAKSFGSGRIALIGEAAHVFPPIGAQGLNLSFRDAATFAECVINAKQNQTPDQPYWTERAIADYDKKRRVDVWSRTAAVDLLNRSLISDMLPFQAMRSVGLHALRVLPSLRRFTMRQGLEPPHERPKLMRPGFSPADL